MDIKKRIEQIKEMENILDKGTEIIDAFYKAYDNFVNYQKEIEKLEHYYFDGEYRKDYELDEQRAFPSDLKRGVLSEDLAYNLLCDNKEIKEKLLKKIK